MSVNKNDRPHTEQIETTAIHIELPIINPVNHTQNFISSPTSLELSLHLIDF